MFKNPKNYSEAFYSRATNSSIFAWRIPINRGTCQATVHGVTKSQTWLSTAQHSVAQLWLCIRKMQEASENMVQTSGHLYSVPASIDQNLGRFLSEIPWVIFPTRMLSVYFISPLLPIPTIRKQVAKFQKSLGAAKGQSEGKTFNQWSPPVKHTGINLWEGKH